MTIPEPSAEGATVTDLGERARGDLALAETAGLADVRALSPDVPLSANRLRQLRDRVTVTGERGTIDVDLPLTGEVFADVPAGTAEDVAAAVARARIAQERWAETPMRDRARVLRRFATMILQRQVEILDVVQMETGKSRASAFEEVADVAIVANHYARTGARDLAPVRRPGALPLLTQTTELRHPRGVIGFIAPWNYPLSMGITDALPALMAGNGAVIKPASQTPYTLLWVAELMDLAGLPRDLLHVVTGSGSIVGTAIVETCDFVTFTGSTATGTKIAEGAASRLIGCALELGGKNALLVLDDASMTKAVDIAIRGTYANAGQLCISFERIYVHESLRAEFTRRFVDRVEGLELSNRIGWGGDVGSLISEDQLQVVTEHVEDAVAKGATVLAGGLARPDIGPRFFGPTVLTDVTPDMTVFAEETFGPVVSIYGYADVDDAIERINASRYGLNAAVVTRNVSRGKQIGARLEAGTVNVNEAYAAAWASAGAPMGGFKDSGLGRRHGVDGIHKYTEVQTVAVQRLLPVTEIPFLAAEQSAKVLTVALRALHALPLRR